MQMCVGGGLEGGEGRAAASPRLALARGVVGPSQTVSRLLQFPQHLPPVLARLARRFDLREGILTLRKSLQVITLLKHRSPVLPGIDFL